MSSGEVFIYTVLIKGLKTGDVAPEKAEITISDLKTYVTNRLKNNSVPMTPSLVSQEEGDQLVIAGNPNRREPIDRRVIEGLASKEFKDIVPQLGAISLLGDQLKRLSDVGRAQAKKLLMDVSEDEERVGAVRHAARSVLNLHETARQVLTIEWKRNPDDVKRDADELPSIREQLVRALEGNKLTARELEQAKSLELAKQIVGNEWKRDPDEVLHDANQLVTVRTQLTQLSAEILPLTEKQKKP